MWRSLMNTLLYISGFVAVLSTLMVITRTNAVHALLYLIVSLLSVSLGLLSPRRSICCCP